KQLLLILVDNAFKHTPVGTRVTLGLAAQGNGGAHLWVADNGPGIPPPHARRIFDRIYRLDKARSRHSGGSGLGLSIARWIVAAHGGHIELDSRPGTGARFTITLPAAPGPASIRNRHGPGS
ncbi:MAG: sensor histidine kinase, partial [Anaerolineae bacterium]